MERSKVIHQNAERTALKRRAPGALSEGAVEKMNAQHLPPPGSRSVSSPLSPLPQTKALDWPARSVTSGPLCQSPPSLAPPSPPDLAPKRAVALAEAFRWRTRRTGSEAVNKTRPSAGGVQMARARP
ncbi:hypothetical protein HPB50_006339 [Hyalomma asiaticum]|uniref:Uncharacterized protein n=1 Tax=Hyalomma asiaticum TaxID=266040 RepID=A0ACB7S1Q3_HYAAI|nr:hypothetical protein HPB50_006339 [Hyalomma asiaticum]